MKTNLKKCRVDNGYTVAQVAAELGITPQSIYQFESGKKTPNIFRLTQLSKLYDVKIDELIGGENNETV